MRWVWFLFIVAAAAMGRADKAVIVNSGSTNTPGFRIVVARSGTAEHSGSGTKKIPAALLQRFFEDLDAAQPLSDLPTVRCMKSASFGTTLTIEYAGQTTPDLSCGDDGNAKLQALIRDSGEIAKLFDAQQGVTAQQESAG